jgi:heptosyltransferase II
MSQPLVVRLCNWIGDVVLSLPALRLLQARGFDLHLYGKGWAPTLLLGYDWPVTIRADGFIDRIKQLAALKRSLTTIDPSIDRRTNALAMPNSFSSALELRLAGFRTSGYTGDGRALLLAQAQPRPARKQQAHELEMLWRLACGILGVDLPAPERIEMRVSMSAQGQIDQLISGRGWQRGYICLVPFSTGVVYGQSKKWPHFPAFAAQLARIGLPLVVCPGPGEREEALSSYPDAIVLDDLKLDAYAALLQRSRLVVANDTGPAHIAAAVGAPLLSLLGPTRVERWGPWGPNATVLRRLPAWPSADDAMRAAERLLAGEHHALAPANSSNIAS